MKRLIALASLLVCVALVIAMRPAEGQDNLQDRVSALETRVAELQSIIGPGTDRATSTPAVVHTISGTFTIRGDRSGVGRVIAVINERAGDCTGYGGFDDIGPGTAVTIRDENAVTIAVGRLSDGTWTASSNSTGRCAFSFSVPNVPDRPFYSIEVSHRGEISASREELEANRWQISLALG